MINKISIKGPASYKNMAIFETDKNINLIYGLNGSGKSTLSEFLRKRTDNEYAECSISPLLDEDAEEILVYNENYVNDVFYSSDTQKGIFSLSKENAGARKRIDAANAALQVANRDFQKQELLQEKELEAWTSTKSIFANRFWQIKTQYTGGDRVLEYCFTGLKSSKELLLNHIVGEYLQSRGKKDFNLIGYDLLERNVTCLKEGSISFLIAQQPELQGANGIKALCDHLIFKKEVTCINYMPIDLLTVETIDYYHSK